MATMELEKVVELPSPSAISPNPFSYHHDPVESALLNPVILTTIFKNFGLPSLKKCRMVCSTWSSMARPFLHPDSMIKLCDAADDTNYNVLNQLDALLADGNIPCGAKFDIGHIKGTYIPQILDKIKDKVECLQVHTNPEENQSFADGPYSHVMLPYLKALSLRDPEPDLEVDMDDLTKDNALFFLDLIRRSPNLRKLSIEQDDLPRIFHDTVLGPEGLGVNEEFKQRLEFLDVQQVNFNNTDIDAFRKMKLRLKRLDLELYSENNDCQIQSFPSIPLWIKDLSPTLETLTIWSFFDKEFNSRNIFTLEFLTEMKKLKNLTLNEAAMIGVKDICPLLKFLPALEGFVLIEANSTGVSRKEFAKEEFKEQCYPNVKDFRILTKEFKRTDCSPVTYVPQLFPNLKKLSISVYSKNTFLAVIHELKTMMIEELQLRMESLPDEFETDVITYVPWGWKTPSFNSWKKLRQLSLTLLSKSSASRKVTSSYNQVIRSQCSMIKMYGMPMEDILPSSVTGLKLNDLGSVDASYLVKLLKGLPLLLHLDLFGALVLDENKQLIEHSVFMNTIKNDGMCHSSLYIPNFTGVFKEEDDVQISKIRGLAVSVEEVEIYEDDDFDTYRGKYVL